MTPRSPACDAFDAALPAALDATLAPDDRAAFDAHRATCATCAALAADLEALMRDARALPDLSPPADLWPGIAARIAPRVLDLPARATSAPTTATAPSAPPAAGWRRLAAAAALVAVSVGGTVLVMRGRAPVSPDVAAGPGQPKVPRPVLASRPSGDETLSAEVQQLEQALDARAAELDPETAAIVRRNLDIIDRAIADARAALASDPANPLLDQQLTRVLGKKVELMRRAAMLPART